MDKTIYRQSKVMGFDHKVINLVGAIIYLKIYWCELKLLNLFREGLKNLSNICVTTTVQQSGRRWWCPGFSFHIFGRGGGAKIGPTQRRKKFPDGFGTLGFVG